MSRISRSEKARSNRTASRVSVLVEAAAILADIVIIGIGVFWIVVCWKEISHYPNERLFSAPTSLWYAPLLGLPILWGMVLVSIFLGTTVFTHLSAARQHEPR